jgi:vitamin B12 transporter
VSYTWLDAKGEDGVQETRRPRHSGAVSLSYDFLDDRARVGVNAVYNGENPQNDFGAGTRVLADDYLVVDLSGAYRLTDTVELYGGVNNVFDSDNEDVLGYAGQPLTGFLGLRAAF